MPTIATVIINSIKVKPQCLLGRVCIFAYNNFCHYLDCVAFLFVNLCEVIPTVAAELPFVLRVW